jgi:hypothetical protein
MEYPFDHRKSPVMDLKGVIATSNVNRYVVSEKSAQAQGELHYYMGAYQPFLLRGLEVLVLLKQHHCN